MPFTISHPAIVLPLKQLKPEWFSLSGLMAGALAPDLIYFLLLDTTYRGVSHSWTGLFVVCLPLGIIFSIIFHRLFKEQLIVNLPRPLDRIFSGLAFSEFKIKGIKGWSVLIISVLIGSLSHFFWDSFTHGSGELAKMIPLLQDSSSFFGITRPHFRWAQHISTVLGAVIIPVYLVQSRLIPGPVIKYKEIGAVRKLKFWILAALVAVAFAFLTILLNGTLNSWMAGTGTNHFPLARTFGLAGWAGFFYATIIMSLFRGKKNNIRLKSRKKSVQLF